MIDDIVEKLNLSSETEALRLLGKPKFEPVSETKVYSSITGRWLSINQDDTDEQPVLDVNGWRK